MYSFPPLLFADMMESTLFPCLGIGLPFFFPLSAETHFRPTQCKSRLRSALSSFLSPFSPEDLPSFLCRKYVHPFHQRGPPFPFPCLSWRIVFPPPSLGRRQNSWRDAQKKYYGFYEPFSPFFPPWQMDPFSPPSFCPRVG